MTELNKRHAYCGSSDVSLCKEGIDSLMEKKKNCPYPFICDCRILTSGMKRTFQTLEILYPDQKKRAGISEDFREIDFGSFEGFSYEQLKDRPDYQKWIDGDNEANVCPNGESGVQMKKRVMDAFRKIAIDDYSYAIFTHGGPIACIMECLFPLEGKNRWEWQSDFGEGYILQLKNNKWSYKKMP
ncbi:MAG: histidine phosphatase family protein [Treponema sp.]|nr:histidine phosphatase family protein [Treponema sp.]